jgi:hypothetical protein
VAPTPLVPADAVTWAMDPQAHAVDLTTIAESPDGARDQARTVRHRYPGLPLAVTASFGRHGQPDPRRHSLFAAGWTLALIGALGEGGADSVTLVDPWPDADGVASPPIVHVLAALRALYGLPLRPVTTTVDTVRAVRIDAGDREVLFIANLAPRPCELALPPQSGTWTTWLLDADTPPATLAGAAALVDPRLATASTDRLTLGPCAIVRMDAARRRP